MSLPKEYWDMSSLQKNKNNINDNKNKLNILEDDIKIVEEALNEKNNNKMDEYDFSSSSLKNKNKSPEQNKDNSLNLSYLIKQSTLGHTDDNNSASGSSTTTNGNNQLSIKRENSNNNGKNMDELNSKKIKSEIINPQSEPVNMIPQIPQYDYQLNSINPAFHPYNNYPNVSLFNSLVQPVQPQYYIVQNKNQVPVISNYPSGNSSPQLQNSYINVNPLNITSPVNSSQITTPIATQIAQSIPGQITTQIPSQIASQLSNPINQQISQVNPIIPVQPATNVYPIFNMNKNSNSGQKNIEKNTENSNNNSRISGNVRSNSNSSSEIVIDLTESNNNTETNKPKDEIAYKSLSDLENGIDKDDKYTILNKIKFAQKKQEYYYNLSQKYTEFINNATNKLISLQEKTIDSKHSIYSEPKKYEKPKNDIVKIELDDSQSKINTSTVSKNTVNTEKKSNNSESKKSNSSESKKSNNSESKKSNNSESKKSEKKITYEKNIISAPSLEEQFKNLKKRNSTSEFENTTTKRLKMSTQEKESITSTSLNNKLSSYNNKSPSYNNEKLSSYNNKSPSYNNEKLSSTSSLNSGTTSTLYNKSSLSSSYNDRKTSSNKISSTYNDRITSYNNKSPSYINRYPTYNNKSPVYNNKSPAYNVKPISHNDYKSTSLTSKNSEFSNIKTTNQKEGSVEIKIRSQNTKSRLISRSVYYEKKITDRKPRKYIHFQNSYNMIITSLGGEILFYDTKRKEEQSSLQAPSGGWPEDVCSISDELFAISTLNKNKNKVETQLALISTKYGIKHPKLYTFKNFKPHDTGSTRVAYIGESNNTYKLLTAGTDHKIFLWDIKYDGHDSFEADNYSFVHERHSSAIQGLCYNSWNDTVYSGGSDCKLFGFNLNTRRTTFQNRYDMRISSILRNPVDVNQLLVMSSATKDQFRICDIRSKKTVLNFGIPTNDNITQYAYPDYHKDGYLISFGSQNTDERDNADVYIWDIRYISPHNSFVSDIKLAQGRIIKPLFSPIKSQFISIDTNGKAAFVNYQIFEDKAES